jgi:hypothetical protein
MQKATFAPGVRLSFLDAIVLVIGGIGTLVLGALGWWLGFVVGFVVGHFFLFCNVFRVSRPLELAWAGVFVVLAMGTIAFDIPGWLITTMASLGATVLVVLLEMRRPSYHGLGWQRINPGLRAWWEGQGEEPR